MADLVDAQALVASFGGPSLELAISAWLDAKGKRSGSRKTLRAYTDTLASFREACRAIRLKDGTRLDLDYPDAGELSLVAQVWANVARADLRPVTPATFNQRLAIVSSFYQYARRHRLLNRENPAELVERRQVQSYAAAVPLAATTVVERLSSIDCTSSAGMRDYALLAVALQTGRRLSELAGLRWGHVQHPAGMVTLEWPHAKGGKVMRDKLPKAVGDSLLQWLHNAYGAQLGPSLPIEAPVWISLARNASHGHALGIQSIADICEKRLGTSKMHATRHTFAHGMEQVGAKVSDIQARLGHASLQTTGRYLAALNSAENTHGDALAVFFGLAPEPRRAKTTKPLYGQRRKGDAKP